MKPIPEPVLNSTSILVVDDLPAARRIVMRMLKLLGFQQMKECGGKNEALKLLKSEDFSLVITDLHLKDGLGTELLETARKEPELQGKPVRFLIVTSDMDKESFHQAIKAGITSYLLKPFTQETLSERVLSALQTPPR